MKQRELPARSSWNVNVSQRGKHSWKIWVKVKGSPLVTTLVLNYFASLDAVPNSHPAKLNPIKQIYPLQCGNAFFSSMKTLILVKTFNVILSVVSHKGCGFWQVAREISRFQVFFRQNSYMLIKTTLPFSLKNVYRYYKGQWYFKTVIFRPDSQNCYSESWTSRMY